METKQCTKCSKIQPLSGYGRQMYKTGYKYRTICKACTAIYRKIYRNSDLGKATLKKYADSGQRYQSYLKNKEKYLNTKAIYRKELSDQYVKKVISRHSNLGFKDITPELIEMKRKQLKLYRDVKEKSNNSN
jgi:hypothetical protein